MREDRMIQNIILMEILNDARNKKHKFSKKYKKTKKAFIKTLGKENKKGDYNNIKRRVLVIISLVSVILVPVTAYATIQNITPYEIRIEKNGTYGYRLTIHRNEKENVYYHSSVRVSLNIELQDYCIDTDGTNYRLTYNNGKNMNISTMFIGLEDGEDVSFENVINAKKYQRDDRQIVLMYLSENNYYCKDMLVIFNQYGYAVEIKAQREVAEETLFTIAENIMLESCKKSEQSIPNYKIYRNQDSKKEDENKEIWGDGIINVETGFSLEGLFDDKQVSVIIKDYKISSTLMNLDKDYFKDYEHYISRIINENDELIDYKREKNYVLGDGINKINNFQNDNLISLKMILLDIEITNTGDSDIEDVRLAPQICCLWRKESKLYVPTESYSTDSGNLEGWAVYSQYTSSNSERHFNEYERNNKLTVYAGETIYMRLGYIVDADRMNDIVFFYNSQGILEPRMADNQAVIKIQ